MKTTAKFIVLHPSVHKSGGGGHRAWLAVFVLFFVFTFAFTLITTKDSTATDKAAGSGGGRSSRLPQSVVDALLHYATENSTAESSSASSTDRMSTAEVKSIATVLRRCPAPCNLLVFGITRETLLWHALNHNHGGRTVFVGESSYQISKMEERHPWIEAYDVQFTTAVRELPELIDHFRREVSGECRPVQNLLFSDCRLAINDLPNHVYDLAWDVIVVDGPRGFAGEAPGRAAVIFTAGVLARSKRVARGTHVFVHEIGREVEKVCSEEFLCRENLVEKIDSLAHFLVGKPNNNNWANQIGFCSNFHSSQILF